MITDRDFDLAMKRLREEMAETYGGGVERAEAAAKEAYELADKAYGQLSEIDKTAEQHARWPRPSKRGSPISRSQRRPAPATTRGQRSPGSRPRSPRCTAS